MKKFEGKEQLFFELFFISFPLKPFQTFFFQIAFIKH